LIIENLLSFFMEIALFACFKVGIRNSKAGTNPLELAEPNESTQKWYLHILNRYIKQLINYFYQQRTRLGT